MADDKDRRQDSSFRDYVFSAIYLCSKHLESVGLFVDKGLSPVVCNAIEIMLPESLLSEISFL